ncbi:restriction endonuclease subunit S [Bacillus smithii]|uniref:restriction endonuclease subunit S n=1 Tax=Bacillus smithii TaxID=1479 RepID=UPI0030C9B978
MNFKLVKLEDIAQISTGGTPSRSNPSYWENGGIPWVKIRDLKKKFVNETEEFITEEGLYNSSAKLFPKGTLLYTIFATIGECAILNIDATTNQAIAGLIVNNEKALTEYVYYFLKSIKEKVMYSGRGVAQNNINLSMLKGIEIPLPNLKIQKKIVEILNKASELIEKRKAQIEALDQLTQSVFLEMFGDPDKNTKQWNVYKLKEVVDKNCSISYGIVQPGDDVPNGVPIVRPVDIQQGIISVDNLKRTAKHISDAYSRTILKGCELLLTVRGTVGASYLVDESFKGVNVTRGITPLLFNEKIVNPIYIFHLFKTEQYQRKFKSLAKGITLLQINLIDLRELTLPVPPVTVQNEFSKFVKKITIQKKKLQNSLNEMETIFNSLMQRAFKGELFNELMNTK